MTPENKAILDALQDRPPRTRKEIYDDIGTQQPWLGMKLNIATNDISKRLDVLRKAGLVEHVKTDESGGLLCWKLVKGKDNGKEAQEQPIEDAPPAPELLDGDTDILPLFRTTDGAIHASADAAKAHLVSIGDRVLIARFVREQGITELGGVAGKARWTINAWEDWKQQRAV